MQFHKNPSLKLMLCVLPVLAVEIRVADRKDTSECRTATWKTELTARVH